MYIFLPIIKQPLKQERCTASRSFIRSPPERRGKDGYKFYQSVNGVWLTNEVKYIMNEPFEQIDLHGLRQDEAIRVIDTALRNAGPMTYQLRLIHGYHRGTSLRGMIRREYSTHPKVLRIMPGDNPGITVLVLKELF